MTRIIKLLGSNLDFVIRETSHILRAGGLVVYPSDTVYGLLVDAQNELAVSKLISFKNRAPGKAISIFVKDMTDMAKYASVDSANYKFIEKLLPGPFTLIFDSKSKVSAKLKSESKTIGLRIPDYLPVQKLVSFYGLPLTATSANLGGRHPNYSIESLIKQLPESKKNLLDLIVDAGRLPRNLPSTVVDMTSQKIKFLRKGDIIFTNSSNFISNSPWQTRQLGHYLISTTLKRKTDKAVIFIIKGELGAGKTELTRGIAGYFGIENIVSPTFVVYYEYDIKKISNSKFLISNYSKFVHADLFNIEEAEEFKHLGLEDYFKPGVIMCVEWGEKLGELYEKFKKKAKVIFVEIKYKSEKEREIKI